MSETQPIAQGVQQSALNTTAEEVVFSVLHEETRILERENTGTDKINGTLQAPEMKRNYLDGPHIGTFSAGNLFLQLTWRRQLNIVVWSAFTYNIMTDIVLLQSYIQRLHKNLYKTLYFLW